MANISKWSFGDYRLNPYSFEINTDDYKQIEPKEHTFYKITKTFRRFENIFHVIYLECPECKKLLQYQTMSYHILKGCSLENISAHDKFLKRTELQKYTKEIKEILDKKIQEQIDININIIQTNINFRNDKERFRRNLAIYRLYRLYNFSLFRLRMLTGITHNYQMENNIGETFKWLCINDSSCVFKRLLE